MDSFREDFLHIELRCALEPTAEDFAGANFVEQSALHDFDARLICCKRDEAIGWKFPVQGLAEIDDLLLDFFGKFAAIHRSTPSKSQSARARRDFDFLLSGFLSEGQAIPRFRSVIP